MSESRRRGYNSVSISYCDVHWIVLLAIVFQCHLLLRKLHGPATVPAKAKGKGQNKDGGYISCEKEGTRE